jgi:Rod binding domain-containing protein
MMKITNAENIALLRGNRHIEKPATADQSNKDDEKLREASKKLEGQFLTFMLKAMESTIPKDEKDNSQSLATMMFSSVLGNDIAENGGIGLADFIYGSLKEHGSDALKNMQEGMVGINPAMNLKITDLDHE